MSDASKPDPEIWRRVQLKTIVLTEGRTFRTHDIGDQDEGIELDSAVKAVEFAKHADEKHIVLRPSFLATLTRRDRHPHEAIAFVDGKYVIVYAIDKTDDLTGDDISKFADSHAVFHAWPYWREYASNQFSRMGLMVAPAPLYRISEKRKDNQ